MGLILLIAVVLTSILVLLIRLLFRDRPEQVNPCVRRKLNNLLAEAMDQKPNVRSSAVQARPVRRMTQLEQVQQAAERLDAADKARLLSWLQAEAGDGGKDE